MPYNNANNEKMQEKKERTVHNTTFLLVSATFYPDHLDAQQAV